MSHIIYLFDPVFPCAIHFKTQVANGSANSNEVAHISNYLANRSAWQRFRRYFLNPNDDFERLRAIEASPWKALWRNFSEQPSFRGPIILKRLNLVPIKMERDVREENAPTYSAEKVSQGQIVLKRPWQRAVFIGGLAAAILVPLIVEFFMR